MHQWWALLGGGDGVKRLAAVGCVVALVCGCAVGLGQEAKPAPASDTTQAASLADKHQIEILSDTQGVDFKPYLKDALGQIYRQWLTLMPKAAKKQKEKGVTLIRLTISPDGTIAAMHLDSSAKDDPLDRAAWGAISAVGKFPALPSTFHGPNLEVRIHFLVNEGERCSAPGKAEL
jgi:TonB family protein